ncbi:MAG: energy transducer TonB [Betaproteobacteria bacterium]
MTAAPRIAARPSSLNLPKSQYVNAAIISAAPGSMTASRLPLSFTASVVIHLLVLVMLALLLRAMPATVVDAGPTSVLSANIIVLPPLRVAAGEPLPVLEPVAPIQSMLPLPAEIPIRTTQVPGVSVAPAKIQVVAEFAPIGKISYGASDARQLFGDDIAAKLARRFSDPAARMPRLNGTLSAMYPIKGAAKGQSLALTALLMIDQAGKISEARVLPDDPVFVAAVMAALKNAPFYPAQFNGKPIPYWTALDFKFSIDGPTGPDGKRLDR